MSENYAKSVNLTHFEMQLLNEQELNVSLCMLKIQAAI